MKTEEKPINSSTILAPLSAEQVLDNFFLEARSKLLDVAAILDRIQRGTPSAQLKNDPRMIKIHKALTILLESKPASAEQIQHIFSLAYDPTWARPQPKS